MEQKSRLENFKQGLSQSVTLKVLVITILALLLLIPTAMVKDIIRERRNLETDTAREIAKEWSKEQTITGPIITIPYIKKEKVTSGKKTWYETTRYEHHFLPKDLDIKTSIDPIKLKRGIFEVVVYDATIDIKGSFDKLPLLKGFTYEYDKAFITVPVEDLRGLKGNLALQIDSKSLEFEPGTSLDKLPTKGITSKIDATNIAKVGSKFAMSFKLKGSSSLRFIPIGKTTTISSKSTWQHPSFFGNFLPENRSVSEAGYEADWEILHYNRDFPQSWTNNKYFSSLDDNSFGVKLYKSVDDYQKNSRTIKYAMLPIALTFLTFFLVEIIKKKRFHPIQYAIVGFAIILFYTLLISLSEHINFNTAYLISFGVVFLLIIGYTAFMFKKLTLSLLLVGVLAGVYGFIFITLQQEDYALLFGSIGLTVIIAVTMYITRNINWYKND